MRTWRFRDCVWAAVTFTFSRENTSVTSRSRPWRSIASSTTSTGNTSSRAAPHSAAIRRSGSRSCSRAALAQLRRWIVTPLPRVTKPTIRSGGAGLQQRARCVIRRSTPRIMMPPPAPSARLARAITSGCGRSLPPAPGVVTARIAACSWRRLISSRATPANSSSALASPALPATASRLTAVAPARCSSRSTIARPCASVASSCWALNHCRTLVRARWLCTYPSSGFNQSRDGPPCSPWHRPAVRSSARD